MSDVKKMEPEGLKQFPMNNDQLKKQFKEPLKKVEVPEVPPMKVSVGWIDLLKLWVKENLINDIFNSQKGEVMNSKVWYASKTLWTNVLLLLWAFVGPKIGIPTLDPETMAGLLGVVNLALRLITKGSITLN